MFAVAARSNDLMISAHFPIIRAVFVRAKGHQVHFPLRYNMRR
jgi:hypothetical protein